MKIGYFDMVGGAAGDMILAALIDAGGDPGAISKALPNLAFRIDARQVSSHGLQVHQVNVIAEDESDHRHLHHIIEIIEKADASPFVRRRAIATFEALAAAEAKAHGSDFESVHFHEVGAVDAIVDIFGASLLVEQLGFDALYASDFPLGRGIIHCQHGVMPAPAPATLNLLAGYPVRESPVEFETVTPTGAAILTTFCDGFGKMPSMMLECTGVGGGTIESAPPNWLRLLVGSTLSSKEDTTVVSIETNVDDMTPQAIACLCSVLMDAGALDCYVTPILMKKGRPAQLITVLSAPILETALSELLLRHSSTFGLRRIELSRVCLERELITVKTEFGDIRVKVGYLNGERIKASPEFEDCRVAAEQTGVGIMAVQQAALRQTH